MNSYNDFAFVYDRLMKSDVDYERYADYIENLFDMYDKDVNLCADLACGTGNMTIPLAERGYDMTGIDLSQNMLTVAHEKASEKNLDILFLNQNIVGIDLYGTMDAFVCLIDGINYILPPQSLVKMFSKIKRCFIELDGLFIFDISTRYKLRHVLGNNTFVHNDRDIFYTWQNRYIESKKLSDMYLNFFVHENGSYMRFEERHLQRAYSEAELREILKISGFEHVDVFNALTFDAPADDSQRIVFVAR